MTDEIERLYKEVENSSDTEIDPTTTWVMEGTVNLVRDVVSCRVRMRCPSFSYMAPQLPESLLRVELAQMMYEWYAHV